MRSSQILSLFSDRPAVSQRPFSFVLSILAHLAAVALVAFGIVFTPKVHDRVITEHLSVRHLDLHAPDLTRPERAGSKIAYPGPHREAHTPTPGGSQSALRQIARAEPGPQTLVQLDLPTHVKLKEEIPIPTVVIWSPKKTPAKTLVAPLPEKPTAADVNPAADPPNEEVNLADVSIVSTTALAEAHPILPSTTSPMVQHAPDQVQLPPATTSQTTAQPTPTAVMSLSDLPMREGTVNLPPVNETVSKSSQGALAHGPTSNSALAGSGNPHSTASGIGNGQGAGNPGDASAAAGKLNGKQAGTGTSPGQSALAGSGPSDKLTTNQITLPHDGQFDSVVVGASLEAKYPEAAEVWSGRMAYTVYLHVGLAKSWILQYSLPSAEDAAAAGNVSRLEAPWPYNIVRPNLPGDTIDADALMVHGFVNQAGRFERLTVAFPPEFAQAQFVLDALRQWQFRPATQNGQSEKVEVVLIIPEEMD
jgi:hypothetical protein